MGSGPVSVNLRVSREEAFGYGDGNSVVSERLPTTRGPPGPTPFFGQAVFVEASAQGGVLTWTAARASRPARTTASTSSRG